MDFNRVIVSGRLTKDFEIKHTNSGKSVINFSIAINNGNEQAPDYVDCTIYGDKKCETLEKFACKGTGILIEGKWKTDKYQVDGQTRTTNFLLVGAFKILDNWRTQPGSDSDSIGQDVEQITETVDFSNGEV